MSLISIPYVFSAGATIIASQHNSNFSTIVNDYNGNVTDANVALAAAIQATKLNLAVMPALGGTTANTGAFTTLTASTLNTTGLVTVASLLVGSVHQGDVLYDNGTSLVRLTPGTAGQFLQTKGASANPVWASSNWVPNNIQVFSSSGTWTKPSGVSTVYAKALGQGGTGGNPSGGTSIGGGGGGGGYAEGFIAVTGDVTVTINSTSSTFVGTTTLTANAGGTGGNTAAGTGGAASNGQINLTGNSGMIGAATATYIASGKGADALMGFGAGGAPVVGGTAGNAGQGFGAGGSAGGNGQTGGAGSGGLVIVYY